jgi:integrase
MPPGDEADRLSRWHANVANGSQVYADVSLRRLRAFCEDSKLSASKVAELEVPELRRALEDYLSREKRRGHSGEYIRTTLKAVRSWRLYNERPYVEGLKVPNATLSPRVENETLPTQADLRRVLLAAKPHERVSISLMAFSGLRPQSIGSYDGMDGLTVGDLPELKVDGKSVSFEKIPTIVRVRAKNSKAKHGYISFLGSEGCLAIQQYIEQRLIAGERIDSKTDLVHPERSNKRFIRALNVGDGIRRAMRAAGLDQRPYVWRTYFLSRLLEAANAGKVSDRYVEFWAGHVGDVTSKHYTVGRANLPISMVEDMRAAYKRAESFLATVPTGDEAEQLRREFEKLLLVREGFPPTEAEKLAELSADQILEELSKHKRGEAGGTVQPSPPARGEGGGGRTLQPPQRIVTITEAEALLSQGWEVCTSAGERLVMRLAS